MAEPSNIRVNPFTGTGGATNYVELTEKHIIPANSPYVIRLNEVPEKQDPSNMKMVYVDSATGAATENVLTEVAATPGQGEFRPDYSTNALEDKTWNTGLIEFSASDAGKIVQVTYTGTGTLAGVNSNHWPSWYTDRGDGSDGDFVPTENTTISGVKNYKSVFIKEGITVTVDKYTLIKCQGEFINNGIITATGKGGAAAKNDTDVPEPSTNGSMGGGAYSKPSSGIIFQGISVEKQVAHQLAIELLHGLAVGGGGSFCPSYASGTSAAGGNGGGAIVIVASEIKNTNIESKGVNGRNTSHSKGGSGGGGGGTIVLIANKVQQGACDVTKGIGGTGAHGGKGGDGEDGFIYIKELGVI